MKVLDPAGNVALVDRETGEDHICILHIAREILTLASPAHDGAPRYVDKDLWDGKLAVPAQAPVAVADEPRADQEKRDADIAAALDLLNEHDFVKGGPRVGRPKCSAVENIVGYPVFTEEVDTAWDKRAK
jgi:hypothetical protein